MAHFGKFFNRADKAVINRGQRGYDDMSNAGAIAEVEAAAWMLAKLRPDLAEDAHRIVAQRGEAIDFGNMPGIKMFGDEGDRDNLMDELADNAPGIYRKPAREAAEAFYGLAPLAEPTKNRKKMPRMAGNVNADPRVVRPAVDNPAQYSDAPAGVSSPSPEEDWVQRAIDLVQVDGEAGISARRADMIARNDAEYDEIVRREAADYSRSLEREAGGILEALRSQPASAPQVSDPWGSEAAMSRLDERIQAKALEKKIESLGGVDGINQKIAENNAASAMQDQIEDITSGKRTKKSGGKGLKQRLEQAAGAVGNKAMNVDEAIQKQFRKLYGLSDDGVASRPDGDVGKMAQYLAGRYMHPSHPKLGGPYDFEDTRAGHAAFYGSRAAQAGLITGAGAGLYNLTNAMQNEFGGPADEPATTELNPGY